MKVWKAGQQWPAFLLYMLTRAWNEPKLEYHEQQAKAWRTNARFVALKCGRGSGKTVLARRRSVRFLNVKTRWQNPIYVYGLPTHQQAKRIAWREILKLVPTTWLKKEPNVTDMLIETIFGSQLYIVGMDKPQRIEGIQVNGFVLDESSDQKPGVFERTVLPMLSERSGWCWRIGVPKRHGIGFEDFNNFFKKGLQGLSLIPGNPTLRIESYTWSTQSLSFLPHIAAELEFARGNMTTEDFDEQYGAVEQDSKGKIFYAYSDVFNVDKEICYNEHIPLVIGSDFNVDPMAWVIGHHYPNRLEIFDEIWLRNTSTQQTLDYLFGKYGHHKAGFKFYGDATGRARRSSANTAAQSDYLLIRADKRFKDASVYYPAANPGVADRFAATNALCKNANDEFRLKVHPRCENLRRDFLARTYIEGTREPDDKGDVGHITDAIGYLIHRLFPIQSFSDFVPKMAAFAR